MVRIDVDNIHQCFLAFHSGREEPAKTYIDTLPDLLQEIREALLEPSGTQRQPARLLFYMAIVVKLSGDFGGALALAEGVARIAVEAPVLHEKEMAVSLLTAAISIQNYSSHMGLDSKGIPLDLVSIASDISPVCAELYTKATSPSDD